MHRMKTLYMHKQAAAKMLEEADKMRRKVRCGIVVGKESENRIIISDIINVRNTADQWHHHLIPEKEGNDRAIQLAEQRELDVVGEYHTHRKLCKITTTDRELLKSKRKALWFIVTPDALKAFDCHVIGEEVMAREIPIYFISKKAVPQEKKTGDAPAKKVAPKKKSDTKKASSTKKSDKKKAPSTKKSDKKKAPSTKKKPTEKQSKKVG